MCIVNQPQISQNWQKELPKMQKSAKINPQERVKTCRNCPKFRQMLAKIAPKSTKLPNNSAKCHYNCFQESTKIYQY